MPLVIKPKKQQPQIKPGVADKTVFMVVVRAIKE
jgi:hypothetical protein